MRETHWGKGTIGLQTAVPNRPHTRSLTFTPSMACTVIVLPYLPHMSSADTLGVSYYVHTLAQPQEKL